MSAQTWLLVLLAACGGDSGAPQPEVDANDTPADGVPVAEVRFQRDVVPIFAKSCGSGNDACHNRKPFAANKNFDCRGWLSLENASIGAQIYAGSSAGQSTGCPDMPLHFRVTQLAPWQCAPTTSYAKAGDLSKSYFIDKINGTNLCPDGNVPSKQMPPADSVFKLSAQDRETIEAWIMAGAKND